MTKAIDRTGWGAGPWDGEPDREEWEDEATGLHCLALRGNLGNWCGYVGVPEGHPAYGWNYDGEPAEVAERKKKRWRENMDKFKTDFEKWKHEEYTGPTNEAVNNIRVHGGLTYAGKRTEVKMLWYYGFDCAHCYDLSPGLRAQLRELRHLDPNGYDFEASRNIPGHEEVYRTLEYVKQECKELAAQLGAMK